MTTSESDPATTEVVPATSSDQLVGLRFADRYEIIEPLGRGGMATVHLAHDRNAGQRVVVKMPRVDLVKELGRDMLLRFAGEMDAQAELEHNHIVRIRDRGRVEVLGLDLPFVVADFKDGGDLEKRLREGKQDLAEVLEWLVPISRALDFSHECGWVHRDVKPDNILYDRQGFVYLSDFGIAKKIETGPDTLPVEGEAPATTFGHVIGTPGYIPPEAVSRDYTSGYDQYSLAVVVAQALSGERPKAEGAASRVKELLPAVPPALRRPLRRALAGDPRQRFPSCREFAEALRTEALRDGTRRRTVWLTAAFLVLAGGAATWLFLNGPGESIPSAEPEPTPVIADPVPTEAESEKGAGGPPADTAPRRFTLGSAPAERDEALALCRERLGDACRPEWFEGETLRTATLRPYALDSHEVTRAEFAAFIDARPTRAEQNGSYDVFDLFRVRDSSLSWRNPGWPEPRDDQPVVHVSREEAAAYCESVGGRLPTEDEWEAIARGDTSRLFPWGDAWDGTRARWFGNEEVKNPAPVAQFDPAPEGYYDLAGNVWEWTSTREDGRDVAKGGSFADASPANLRGASRQVAAEGYTSIEIGFRCARDRDAWPASNE